MRFSRRRVDSTGWKDVNVEYGKNILPVKVPPYCDTLTMGHVPALKNAREKIENALSNPIGSSTIKDIVTSSEKPPSRLTVAVVVSDNTRPVPYCAESEEGILYPLLKRLKRAGIKNENIRIIVGTGTHLPTSGEWKRKAFGEVIVENYRIVDHDSTSPHLFPVGSVEGIEVKINREFMEADIRMVTGLVEPHFMAGVSGGRKAVCPGIVNLQATYLFHGVDFTNNPSATNLALEGNPCHEFALKVARRVGVDFSVNCTVNEEGSLSGVFAGDLKKAHLEAVNGLKKAAVIPCHHTYDIVLTSGGKVAVNHYQAAKAAYGTIPIIRRGGKVILAAHNSDEEPVGKDEYKKALKILKKKGPGGFTEFIKSKTWQFVPDQWQVQKWDQFFRKVGSFDNLIYCTTNIPPEDLEKLPGKSGYDFVEGGKAAPDEMVQRAIIYAVDKKRQELNKNPEMAFVKEGPYAVPVLR